MVHTFLPRTFLPSNVNQSCGKYLIKAVISTQSLFQCLKVATIKMRQQGWAGQGSQLVKKGVGGLKNYCTERILWVCYSCMKVEANRPEGF